MGFLFWGKKENKKEVVKTTKAKDPKVVSRAPEKGTEKTVKKNTTNKTKKITSANKKQTSFKNTTVEEKEEPSTKIYHVSLRKDGKWQVKYGGGEKAIKLFETQAEAIEFAKEKADNQDGAISIHKKDGKMRKQDYRKKSDEK